MNDDLRVKVCVRDFVCIGLAAPNWERNRAFYRVETGVEYLKRFDLSRRK